MPTACWVDLPTPPCTLPESPRFAHNTWVWLDITEQKLYHIHASNIAQHLNQSNTGGELNGHQLGPNIHSQPMPDQMACILPSHQPNKWLGLGRQGLWHIELDTTAPVPVLLMPSPFDTNTHRFNDGQTDPKGRVWISSLVDNRQTNTAALYCIEQNCIEKATATTAPKPTLKITERIPGLICGNGLAFGVDGKSIWWADTRLRTVWRALYDPDTTCIHTPMVVHQYHQGTERPDGAAVSADGHYWLAVLDGHRLDRFDEHGNFVERVPVPLAKPTMPCWGGDKLATLLVCGMGHTHNPAINLVACEGQGRGLAARFAFKA